MADLWVTHPVLDIQTQGDTGTPTIVRCQIQKNLVNRTDRGSLRFILLDLDGQPAANAVLSVVAGKGDILEEHTADKDYTIASAKQKRATNVLTLTGVVIQGQKIETGARTYTMDAGGGVAEGEVPIDITGTAAKAQGTMTLAVQPTAGDDFELGIQTYTYVTGAANAPGEISRGANVGEAQDNTEAAIMGTDGVNTPNTLVTIAPFASDDAVITAKVGGVAGNAIASTSNFTSGSNLFDAATLGTTTAGDDTTAAEAVTAIVAAIEGDEDKEVNAADGTGNTVDVIAIVEGDEGNDIEVSETLANGSWATPNLAGGQDDLPGEIWLAITNATEETVELVGAHGSMCGYGCDANFVVPITHAAA